MSSSGNCPTLFAMAMRNGIRNVDLIDSIGDIPYAMVEPILKHIKSPQQLRELEENSPHIKAHSKDLWLAFIRRDIPRYEQKMMIPKNPHNWGGIYRYMLKQDQKAKVEQEEQLRKAMQGITDSQVKSTYLPQVVKQAEKQTDFVDGNWNYNKRHSGWATPRIPTVKNAKAGQFIAALKREAQDTQATRNLAARRAKGAQAHSIPSVKSQIKTAPYTMLADHQAPKVSAAMRRAVDLEQSKRRNDDIFTASSVSARVSANDRALNEAEARERAKRENRLRALANPGAKSVGPSSAQTAASTPSRSSAATSAVTSAQSSRYTPSTPSARSTGTSAITATKVSATSLRIASIKPHTSAQSPSVATKAIHTSPQLSVHGRSMATAKSRLAASSGTLAKSPLPTNDAPATSVGKHAVDLAGVSSPRATSTSIPMIRKRAPVKLFIDHNAKRVKK